MSLRAVLQELKARARAGNESAVRQTTRNFAHFNAVFAQVRENLSARPPARRSDSLTGWSNAPVLLLDQIDTQSDALSDRIVSQDPFILRS